MPYDFIIELGQGPVHPAPRFRARLWMIGHQSPVANGIAAGLIQIFHDRI